ncbi:MAG: lipoate--protein ligase family protein [Thermotogae bacterium]|nr:MAG: lipoate--protein ligase family protein [Thermotogota bacterium]
MELRVIFDGKNKAAWNMALDESLLYHLKEVGPTLRLYGWLPPAVSIGYFQSMEEVNVEKAREMGVDVIRRITGGGAVYHKYELTYSIVMPPPPGKILESYRIIEKGIIEALNMIGVKAEMSGINDIIVEGKKISGNAQTRKYGGLLQHGTLLIDVDVDEMFTLLKVPQEKMRDKIIKSVKERVTSLHNLGKKVNFEELQKFMAEGFAKALNAHLYEENLSQKVLSYAKHLEVNKYATREWNFKR